MNLAKMELLASILVKDLIHVLVLLVIQASIVKPESPMNVLIIFALMVVPAKALVITITHVSVPWDSMANVVNCKLRLVQICHVKMVQVASIHQLVMNVNANQDLQVIISLLYSCKDEEKKTVFLK